jgi:thiamine-phosphate pyrophosphorylase
MGKKTGGIHVLLSANDTGKYKVIDLARIAVEGGANAVQLREKHMTMDELLPIAKNMRSICRDVHFIINDRVDLAKIVEADGVHLGQDDLPIEYARDLLGENSIIGISCGSIDEARYAQDGSADYIGFGHMYPTVSKLKSTPAKSFSELEAVCSSVSIPVIAIGGISIENIKPLLQYKIGGIAVIRAFSNSENPQEVIKQFRTALTNVKQ